MRTTVACTSANYVFHTLVLVSAILAWLTLVDADSASCQTDANTQYRFNIRNRSTGESQLNEVTVPFYIGRSDAPKEGDVIQLDSFILTLGPPGSYTCRYSEKESKKVIYVSPGGKEQLIGIMVNEFYTKHETTLNNPFLRINDHERSLLRSVYLDAWPEGIEKILAKLNTENVCITVTDKTAHRQKRDRGGGMPRLPRDISCLRVVNEYSRGIEDFTALSELNKLRSLAIVDWGGKIDLSTVSFSKKLHF